MKTKKLTRWRVLSAFMCACITLTGCASQPTPRAQIVTPAMTIVPPRPTPPDPATADQRQVALYIVQLRGWGNGLAIQLRAIEKLIQEDK